MAKTKIFQRLFFLILAAFGALPAFAQDAAPEMADQMRASGKIWVVVAVLAIIFAGIIIYLIRLDRKITRLEREVK